MIFLLFTDHILNLPHYVNDYTNQNDVYIMNT